MPDSPASRHQLDHPRTRSKKSPGRRLLDWFAANRRELPWRRNRDPYRVWVSEVMLQQTRVETVLGYYEGFLERFPTIDSLARAELEEVLAAWSGLGYYRRARLLHRSAQAVAEAGSFPVGYEAWRELSGIGEYTAAALASQLDGEARLAVDGNVERVVSRLIAYEGDPRSAEGRRLIVEAGSALLDAETPGTSNEALIELGATVCTARRPACASCSLAAGCGSFEQDIAELLPVRSPRRPIETERRLVVVARDDRGRTLLFRRAEDAEVLAGTWELPWIELDGPEPRPVSSRSAGARLRSRYGGVWKLGRDLGSARHAITFRRLELEAFEALASFETDGEVSEVAEGPLGRYLAAAELARLPRSSLVEKILALAGDS